MGRKILLPGSHPRALPIVTQLYNLVAQYPGSTGRRVSNDGFVWEADLHASALSSTYHVRMEGKEYAFPDIWVSGGAVERCMELEKVPHQFGCKHDPNRIRVCLQKGDWSPRASLSRTAVPWTMEWLFFFEVWMATEEWCGGGIHPPQESEG